MSQIFVLKTLSGELRGTYFFGASSRIRTDDLLITNQLLWPSELSKHMAEGVGFEPTDSEKPPVF